MVEKDSTSLPQVDVQYYLFLSTFDSALRPLRYVPIRDWSRSITGALRRSRNVIAQGKSTSYVQGLARAA
jgi:hypothetical protein